jgi:hypothetical protein
VSSAIHSGYVQVESRFFQRVFFAFVALALLSLLISFAGRQIGSEISMGGHTDDETLREIVIGNDLLNLPSNMIRNPEQRRDGIAKRIDVYAAWPNMTGYSEASRPIFNNLDTGGRLMFISFDRRSMVRDMSGRFEPIYKSMIEGSGDVLPYGLTRYHLPEKAGFVDEYLYVGINADATLFVARCLDPKASVGNLAPCDRDIHVGEDLAMMVRFSPILLGQWRQMDAVVKSFAAATIK